MAEKFKHKIKFTGTPIRKNLIDLYNQADKNDPGRTTIFIFGGSQAAKKFSTYIPKAIAGLDPKLRKKLYIIQQCKQEDIENVSSFYHKHGIDAEIASFFSDIGAKYAQSDIIIARSGASTISELIELAIPAILIPLSSSARNHQFKNALYVANKEAALIVEDADLDSDILAKQIANMLEHKKEYRKNIAKLRVNSIAKLKILIKKLLHA